MLLRQLGEKLRDSKNIRRQARQKEKKSHINVERGNRKITSMKQQATEKKKIMLNLRLSK
jgi:hypothetical protein